MTAVNKAALIERVAQRLGGRPIATQAVESVLDEIVRAVAAGETVGITGFGTFEAVTAESRTARNPATGETFELPSRTRPRFRPHTRFKEYTNGNRALPVGVSSIRKDPKGTRMATSAARAS